MGIQINGSTDRITAIDGTIDFVSNIGNIGLITASRYELLDSITIGAGSTIIKTSNGKLGIGTDNPTKTLQVFDSSATSTTARANTVARFLSNASNADCNIQLSNGVDHSAQIGIVGNGAEVYIAQDGVEKVRIDSAGNVGIGTENPEVKLHMVGDRLQVDNTGNPFMGRRFNAAADGAVLFLEHSRSNTIGTKVKLDDDDEIGSIQFRAYKSDNSTIGNAASIKAEVNGTTSANGVPADLIFNTGTTSSNATEKLRITSAGLVSIPVAGSLQVGAAGSGETDTKVYVANTGGNAYIQVKGADSSGIVGLKFGRNSVANRAGIDWSAATDALSFRSGGTTERLRITSAGLVGINSTTPSEMFDIYNNTSGENAKARICAANGGQAGLSLIAGTGANDRASRIDFVNMKDSSSPQWTIINDYNQNGTNDLGIYHGAEKGIIAVPDGGVELYWNNSKAMFTNDQGITVLGTEGEHGVIYLAADESDDNADWWSMVASRDESKWVLQNFTDGAWEDSIKAWGGSATYGVAFYQNNGHRCSVTGDGFQIEAGHALYLPTGNWSGESSGKIQAHSNHLYFQNPSNQGLWIFRLPNGTEPANINSSGTYSGSDERRKKDITTITNAVSTVKQLTGRSFTWKESDEKSFGVIAQEIETVLPDLVFTQSVPEGTTDTDPYKMVNYAALSGHFIEAIKELSAEVETLKTKVAALESA